MQQLARQNGTCRGCLQPIDQNTARIDHAHTGEQRVRGLLCYSCNWALGQVKDDPGILYRLAAHLDHDIRKVQVFINGALKNERIPIIGETLRNRGYDVLDEWISPGRQADENWQTYEKVRGRTYAEALRGRHATHVFLYDRAHIDMADIALLVMPAGKSAMLELGYAKGRGKLAYIFLDGQEPDRYDIMPNLADKILVNEDDLLEAFPVRSYEAK